MARQFSFLRNLLRFNGTDGPSRSFGNNDPDDFRIVSGILRLATKYLIDSLREKAIAHLTKAWPSTLDEWDARDDIARVEELEHGLNRSFRYPSPIVRIFPSFSPLYG